MLLAEELTAPWGLGARDAGYVGGNFDLFASVVGCESMVIRCYHGRNLYAYHSLPTHSFLTWPGFEGGL